MRRAAGIGLTFLLSIAWAAPSWAADVVEFYHVDAIGNVRVVTDSTGNVVERHDYLPFGEECTTGACASVAATQRAPMARTARIRSALCIPTPLSHSRLTLTLSGQASQ